jgi:chromosome segregation protein
LAAAETELERLANERRRAEAGLADAKEAVALAEAERERQATAQAELEHETTRRLGQSIDLVLAAVNDPEISRALENEPPAALEARLDKLKTSRERLGAVNLRAAIECDELAAEIANLESEAAELEAAVERLRRAIATLNREACSRLEAVFDDVDRHFRHLFQRLFGGGKAHLRLVNMDDPLHAGLELEAMPPGKKLQNIRLLSGGEKSLTALALVFAFFLTQPSPLCVLDEVDAALDDANVERFVDLLDEMAKETRTRFLVVTHHPLTMARMHRLFGVTMAERGVSKLVSVAFDEAERFKESA